MANYRKSININTIVAKPEYDGEADFITADDANEIIDSIEKRVNDIISDICNIKGLSEVDDIKGKLILLSSDLY